MGQAETTSSVVRCAGIRWHLAPGASEILTTESLDLNAHVQSDAARIVKNGPHRTVYRVALPQGNVFWKHCRIAGLRSWARQCLRPFKAKMEFDRALALSLRGILTVEPLAWGVQENAFAGESFLITRELVDAVPLQEYLRSFERGERSPSQRRDITEALGIFFARLHDAGVVQPDMHAGNILVAHRDQPPRFHLIDLHAISIRQTLSWPARRDNLTIFNRWFIDHASRTDRRRFWRAYVKATVIGSRLPTDAIRDLEQRTQQSNWIFREGRDRRCMGTNRYFFKVRSAVASGHATRGIDEQLLKSLLENPDGPFQDASATILKDSRTSTVAEIVMTTADGPRAMIWKRFRVKKPLTPLLNQLRPSPALRSWQAGHAFRDRGLPTARPWLVLHRRGTLGPREGYLLCEKIGGAVDAVTDLNSSRDHCDKWNQIAKLARLIRRMHDLRLAHRDLKAANLLIETASRDIQFIDLVGVVKPHRLSDRSKAKNLARLQISLTQSPQLTQSDRLRFLRSYLRWGLHGRAGWKDWWKMIDGAGQAKIEQNQQRGRPIT